MSFINDAINSLFSFDVVAVFRESDGNQVFSGAKPMKASVNLSSERFKHPLETSVEVIDHRIILPQEVKLQMIIPNGDYATVYQQIKQLFTTAESLAVRTKADFYSNLIIDAMPHEEDPEKFDAITLELALTETLFASVNVVELAQSEVANIVQSSTIDRGVQNPVTPDISLGARALDAITGYFQ